jgi:hypothetical protein
MTMLLTNLPDLHRHFLVSARAWHFHCPAVLAGLLTVFTPGRLLSLGRWLARLSVLCNMARLSVFQPLGGGLDLWLLVE